MNVVRKFRTLWKWLVPGWLQKGQGELVQYTQGLVKDAYAERMTQTAYLPYPSVCVSDALDLHGRSRGLPRGTFEADESYRARLVGWRYPKGHRTRGTAPALLEQFVLALRGTQHVIVDARNVRHESGSYPTISAPAFVSAGAVQSGLALSVPWGSHAKYDIGVLLVSTANVPVATPAGMTLLGAAGVGVSGGGNSSRLSVFYRIAESGSEANIPLPSPGSGQRAVLATYRASRVSAPFLPGSGVAASPDVDDVNAFTNSAGGGVLQALTRVIVAFSSSGSVASMSGYLDIASSAVAFTERFDSGGGVGIAGADGVSGALAYAQARATMSSAARSAGANLLLSSVRNDTWDWDAQDLTPNWARYWLVCHSVGTPWSSFSDPGWIAAWSDPNAVLAGGGVTFGELDAVVKLASNRSLGWSPAGVVPNTLVLYFGTSPFPEPGGNWDTWANRDARYRYVALHPTIA